MFGTPNSAQLSLLDEALRENPRLSEGEAVIHLCERLLQEAEAEPPIPVERVASLRGIVSIRETIQPWAGALTPVPNEGLVVTVRAEDGFERQRFTICHEIGHTLFEGFHQQRQYRCDGKKNRTEQLCDLAASELLLPRRYFSTDLQEIDFSLEGVEELSRRYQASIEATALRTVDLWSDEPTMLLVLRERHKPSERGCEADSPPRLRLDYAHAQGNWPFALTHKSVSDDSPLAAAFNGELIDLSNADLSELFTGELGPVELHARRYGRDGRVLALIRPARRDDAG